jgi:predicted phosphodiesterase
MRLHILSDLHIEFGEFEPPETNADVVVLAGDIDVGVAGVHWAATHFVGRQVIYVPGNHEFYNHDIALVEKLRSVAPGNVHVLDNDEVNIGGTRFLGATLWTDFAIDGDSEQLFAMQYAQQCMADFTIISNGERVFNPEDALKLHVKSRRWLAEKLAEPCGGSTVVITHHAPSAHSIHERYVGSPLSAAFASNLEKMLDADRAALWIHGHMHDSFDYEINGTRVVCNPRGYTPDELNPDFSGDFVVNL